MPRSARVGEGIRGELEAARHVVWLCILLLMGGAWIVTMIASGAGGEAARVEEEAGMPLVFPDGSGAIGEAEIARAALKAREALGERGLLADRPRSVKRQAPGPDARADEPAWVCRNARTPGCRDARRHAAALPGRKAGNDEHDHSSGDGG